MKVEFEWRIVPVENTVGSLSVVVVVERLIGHDTHNEFGPMPAAVAENFVIARRKVIERLATNRLNAIKLIQPRTS